MLTAAEVQAPFGHAFSRPLRSCSVITVTASFIGFLDAGGPTKPALGQGERKSERSFAAAWAFLKLLNYI